MRNNYFDFTKLTFISLVLICVSLGLTANAQKISYPDSWAQQGISLKSQNPTDVKINFSMQEFSIDTRVINGEPLQEINLEGNFLPNGEGAPNLPTLNRYVAIPNGATASIEIVNMRTEKYQNIEIAPAPRIPFDNERGPLQYNRDLSIYSQNAFYPAKPAQLSQNINVRGVEMVILSITPYQYNPVTKELLVYRDLEVKVNYTGGTGEYGDIRLRSRFWDPILMDNAINNEMIPAIDYSAKAAQYTNADATGCEYLIIVPNDPIFRQWADSIKAFRTEQGILTNIVSLQEIGGSTTTIIKDYIKTAFNTWTIPPAAILIMADYGSNAENSITSPIWDNYCVSDNIYADVDNDKMPEIAMARMTANNAEQLQTYVRKFIDYERNPPIDPGFYDHPITALGWQTERWFQVCSEVVGGYFKNKLGKHPVRINAVYQGNPSVDPWSTAPNTATVLNYFGPSGLGYIPATPQELGGWSGGTPAMVNTNLNAGSFMLQHRDHGFEAGWGEPAYQSSSINGLTNIGKLSYIMSVNCLTGKYNYGSECFAEKFHRYKYNGQNAGCVGILAASEVSYSFVNDAFVWGMYDNMWPDFMPSYGPMFSQRGILPAFGNAAGKYFLQQSGWPYNTSNKEVTYNLFHHHGDAFLTVFSEVPQYLTVSHSAVILNALSTFNVTADEGSFIALTANGEIIGTAQGTGSPVAVPIAMPTVGTIVKIVVTKQNYYRHYSSATVIPSENPYVITTNYTLSDPTGNNNNAPDFGEDVLLSLSEKNLGNNPATNVVVTLSSTDQYVTLLDNTETYPTIASQETVTIPNGFKVRIANNVPTGYRLPINVSATNGIDTWLSSITLTCRAPKLNAEVLEIDDSQGGNGNSRLDPGETATISIRTSNGGTSIAPDVTGTISVSTGLITLNNNYASIGTLNPLGSGYAQFNVTVRADAPQGLSVNVDYTGESGAYKVQRTYVVQVGLLVEDWETGDFTKFAWENGGSAAWTVTNSGQFEGVYSAKSGAITHSQNSQLILNYNVPVDDSIRFYVKTSCEPTADGFKFYIDNTAKANFSGETPWTYKVIPVTAGPHTFKFYYTKNAGNTNGSDCAWLDYIVLPMPKYTTSFAGVNNSTCQNTPFQCTGNAANYTTLAWTTSGSGTFSNAAILNPMYSPSNADVTAGFVNLIITATGGTGSVADTMVLTFQQPSVSYAGEAAQICSGLTYTNTSATASNFTNLKWTTSGTGTFSNPSVLASTYTPGIEDIAAGQVTLTLTASNQACPASATSKTLTIHTTPSPMVNGPAIVCAKSAGVEYSTPANNGNTYEWAVTGGSIVSGAATNKITVNWNSDATGSVLVTEKSVNNCQATNTKTLTINPVPATNVSGIATGCLGEVSAFTTNAVSGNTYNWSITGGTINSGQGTNSVQVSWNAAGNNSISLTETIPATQCATIDNHAVVINGSAAVPSKPVGLSDVDLYVLGSSDYTITASNYAQTYVWQLTPAEAGIVSGNTTTGNIVWNSTFRGNASLSVKAVNNCGESTWSETKAIKVYSTLGVDEISKNIGILVSPNPNNGTFALKVNTTLKNEFNIRITSSTGAVVYEKNNIQTDGKYSEAMNLNISQGSYTITVRNADGYAVKKFVVTK